MTDKNARAAAIAKEIRTAKYPDTYYEDELAELCEMAGLLEEWEAAGSWEAGKMGADKAADALGVKIADDLIRMHDQLRCMEAAWGRPAQMSDAQLWEYLNTCQSWDEVREGSLDELVERAGLDEEWQRVQDGELAYEDVLRAACERLGFEPLV